VYFSIKNRQSAAKARIEQGSTTIPLEGSRLQAIGNRSGFAVLGKANG